MLANESKAGPLVLQWKHGKMESVREGPVRLVRFRLGSARLDIEHPASRHLGWVSYVSRACHALSKAKTNMGCVERC